MSASPNQNGDVKKALHFEMRENTLYEMIDTNMQLLSSRQLLRELSMDIGHELPTVAVTVPMAGGHLACNAIALYEDGEPMVDDDGFVRVRPLENIAMMDVEQPDEASTVIRLQTVGGIAGMHVQKRMYELQDTAHQLLLTLPTPHSLADQRMTIAFSGPYGKEIEFASDVSVSAVCEVVPYLDQVVAGGLQQLRCR